MSEPTQHRKRFLLAHSMGWQVSLDPKWKWVRPNGMYFNGDLPDFFSSLDACWLLEQHCYHVQSAAWVVMYEDLLEGTTRAFENPLEFTSIWHASAPARAEALGRSLGLW